MKNQRLMALSNASDAPPSVGSILWLTHLIGLNESNVWVPYTLREMSDPCIRYVPYQFEQSQWLEKPLTDQLFALHDSNLYLSAYGDSISDTVKRTEKNRSRANVVWYYKQVDPYQVSPTYFDAQNRSQEPPLNNKKGVYLMKIAKLSK